jgi:carbonic anhydrase/acetyltransferase-like protein (isoleucine patch superfamily)
MILEFDGKHPRIDPTAFIAENALIIGDVEIGPGANIWFYSIIRGDTNYIRIGANCNIQDACVLHVVKDHEPVILEDGVVLGHRAVVHGCRVGRGSLIGIGALVLNGAQIGEESIIGAGSVVSPRTVIPPRSLAMGIPARVVRTLTDDDLRMIKGTGEEYLELKEMYRKLGV